MSKVINFSDAASIGIHSLIVISKSENPLNAIKLSEKIGYSKHHIGKVMQRLVKDGFLKSYRGPTRGFKMKKNPQDIRIYDIYRSLEGEVDMGECPHDVHICPVDKCIRNELIVKLSQEFVTYLQSRTLQGYI